MARNQVYKVCREKTGQVGMTKLLDLIAKGYYWFYCTLCQRPPNQPYTAQLARFEQRWPVIYWLINTALIAWLGFTHSLLVIPALLFMAWFNRHILIYRIEHPENQSYRMSRLTRWALGRIDGKKIL
jgi:hypothetical protein